MRRSIGIIAVFFGATLLSNGLAHAKDAQGSVLNQTTSTAKSTAKQTQETKQGGESQSTAPIRTHEDLDATPQEKQRAAAAQQAATVEEQRIAGQLRGLQALMQKEEAALAQRLAYAAKLRAQGLAKNDQKMLDQAEGLERQALAYYEKRVKQFEGFNVTVEKSPQKVQQPTRSTRPTQTYRPSRSSSRSRSRTRR